MKALWLALILFGCSLAHASASASAGAGPSSAASASPSTKWMASLGAQVNYQLSANGRTYDAAVPPTARLGYRFTFADIYAEYSLVSSKSGMSYVDIAETRQEFLVWGRKPFRIFPRLFLFGAVGVGAHLDSVETAVGSSSERSVGQPQPVGALATGLEWRLTHFFALSLEGRASFSQSGAPNPLFGLGSFATILF